MDKAERLKKEKNTSFMKNVLMLMVAQFVIKILGFIYRLVIINFEGFGDVGNGYYNAGYQVYSLLLTISSMGIPFVISKLVSERIAVGDSKAAYKIFKISLKVFTIIGAILSLGLFFGAEVISTYILKVPDVKYTLKVLAPAITLVASSAVLRGYFSGLGTLKATSVSQTLEQLFNCILTVCFVYMTIGKDSAIMAAAGNVSTTLAIVISFTYLLIFYKTRKKAIIEECNNQQVQEELETTKDLIKTIFALAIPMTLGSLISVVSSTIDIVTITNCIQKAFTGIIEGGKEALETEAMRLSGILSKVETIIHMPLSVTAAFCTALIPSISSSAAKQDFDTAEKRLNFSLFATILILAPAAVGLSILAKPILQMIYPTASEGATLLILSSITMIILGIEYVINGGLYGLGKVYIPAIALTIGAVIKLVLNIILVSNPKINIYGAAISTIVCQLIAFVLTWINLNKYIKIKLKFSKHIFKPAFSAILMGIITKLSYNLLLTKTGNSISTICSIAIGVISYLLIILFTKALSREDILMIPFGKKIYGVLLKTGIYKE